MSEGAPPETPRSYARYALNLWWIGVFVGWERLLDHQYIQSLGCFAAAGILASVDYWFFVRKGKAKMLTPQLGMAVGAAIFIVSLGWWLYERGHRSPQRATPTAAAQTASPEVAAAPPAGRGGDASVEGDRSFAMGGPGGASGGPGGSPGGRGGDVHVRGNDSRAVGGEGGEGGHGDGSGGRGGRSGLQVLADKLGTTPEQLIYGSSPPSAPTPADQIAQGKGASVPQEPSKTPPVQISGNDNVVSIGQQGGITARNVTINNPPLNPELAILGRTERDNPDGSHSVVLETEVRSPVAPGLLALEVRADGLRDVRILPPPVGGAGSIEKRNVRQGPGSYYCEIPGPRGHYTITITTEKATPISLSPQF